MVNSVLLSRQSSKNFRDIREFFLSTHSSKASCNNLDKVIFKGLYESGHDEDTIDRVTDKMIVAESWRRLGLAFDNKEKDSSRLYASSSMTVEIASSFIMPINISYIQTYIYVRKNH